METDFDCIVVGGGINGAGIARDAAMRGLKVLLIDKGDVGGGTSAASTRLIHGGVRYFEDFEFGLVRESLRERETLLRIAPHLVRPLPITIPIYKHSQRGLTTVRAGMIAYDLLSWGKSLPRHRMQSADETLRQLPGLSAEGLVGSAVYYDAQVEFAERLVVENVLSAIEYGATVLTYTRVTRLMIVVSAVYVEAASDRRPFFVIPWNGNYLIGTTDVRFAGDADEACAEDWEIEYLLSETNRVFPKAELTRERVLYTYSGVRPLPFTTSDNEQSITRRHFLRVHPQISNLISVVGGKLTTYRSLAEECVDLVLRKLGRTFTRSQTGNVPLPGALHTNPPDLPERWQRIYGSRAKDVAALATRLNADALTAEVVFAFENEFAKTLADCFLRRTMIGLNADLGLSQLEAAAEIGRRFLGLTEERAKREVASYRAEISNRIDRGFHGPQ